jgi:hypothetical protein
LLRDLAQAGFSGAPSKPIGELVVVTFAICVGRCGKVPGKSSHLLAVMFGSIVACGALASVALKLGLQATWLIATDTKIHANCERYIFLLFGTIPGPFGLV